MQEDQSFIRSLYIEEERNSERLSNYVRLGMSLLFFAVTAGVAKEVPPFSVKVLTIGSTMYFLFSLFMFFYLRAGGYKPWLKYLSVFVDIFLISGCMWFFGTYRTFKTEAFLLYYVWIALATMRLSERLTLYAGLLCLGFYITLVLLAFSLGTVEPGTISESFVSSKVSPANQVLRVLYMSVVIVAVTYGSSAYRRLAQNTQGKAEQLEKYTRSLERTEESLRRSLSEKDVLLAEIHHRVKNNLAIINALLELQSEKFSDENSLKLIQVSQSRIMSMAMIHERLYQSENFSSIDLTSYIRGLVEKLIEAYHYDGSPIALELDVDASISLQMSDLVPFGLILNELTSNAIKHAFANTPEPRLSISLTRAEGDMLRLFVSDNGSGGVPKNIDSRSTLGLQIVSMLADQLKGSLSFKGDMGTGVELLFRKKPAQQTEADNRAA